MNVPEMRRGSVLAMGIFELLNPVPYGFFVGALIFDITYMNSSQILWQKSASWLITLGLLFAIIPRLINLVQVWSGPDYPGRRMQRLSFWLNVLAIIAAIFNAFVHSRDAYGIVPENVVLSLITVICLALGALVVSGRSRSIAGGRP